MAAIEQMQKGSLVTALRNARGKLANAREDGRLAVKRTVSTGITVGAGYGVGYIYQNHPDLRTIGDTEIETPLAVGGVALLVGLTGILGDQSEHAISLGAGALTGWATLKGAGL